MFVTEESIKLWEFLGDKSQYKFISGCPGIGKSTEVFGWVQYQAITKSVLWIHNGPQHVGFTYFNPDDGNKKIKVTTKTKKGDITKENEYPGIDDSLKAYSIIVYDGFTKNCMDIFHRILWINKDATIICCSSISAYKASMSNEQSYMTASLNNEGTFTHRVQSPIIIDIYDAFKTGLLGENKLTKEYVTNYNINNDQNNLAISNSTTSSTNNSTVDISDISVGIANVNVSDEIDECAVGIPNLQSLETKIYYCGVCWRMLKWSINRIRKFIDDKFGEIRNYETLFKGLVGESNNNSVNSLMQLRNGKSMPLSHYVSRKLLEKVSDVFLTEARAVMQDNPSFQGWLLEYEVIDKIKKKELQSKVFPDPHTDWCNLDGGIKYFYDHKDIKVDDLKNNTCLIPLKYNQACFDVMIFKKKGDITVCGITRAEKSHDYKMHYVIPFANKLKDDNSKCSIQFDIIISTYNKDTYRVKTADFKRKTVLTEFDAKWKNNADVKEICKVYIYDSEGENSIEFDRYDASLESEGVSTRSNAEKKRRVNDDDGDNDDEDDNNNNNNNNNTNDDNTNNSV